MDIHSSDDGAIISSKRQRRLPLEDSEGKSETRMDWKRRGNAKSRRYFETNRHERRLRLTSGSYSIQLIDANFSNIFSMISGGISESSRASVVVQFWVLILKLQATIDAPGPIC